MATRGYIKESEIERISTTQILEKLKKVEGDNTEFFYLYVSTGGEDDDDDDYHGDDEPMEITPSSADSVPPPDVCKKARKKIMKKVHTDILPKVLCPHGSHLGWKKVCDKDMKPTYRALYFKIIPKDKDEDNILYIQRVNKIRSTLLEEVDKLRTKHDVNFKINSLLSKPFLYDEDYLTEQSMREGYTQKRND